MTVGPILQSGLLKPFIQSIAVLLRRNVLPSAIADGYQSSKQDRAMPQVETNGETHGVYAPCANIAAPAELLGTAGVAHELGNLIQIASSAVNIIARNAKRGGAPAPDPVIAGARMSLERAGALVRQAIHHAAHPRMDIDHVDIARSLTEIRDLIQYSWAPKHRVEILTGSGLPAVQCARLGLQSAILNLALMHAIQCRTAVSS
jgi:hypothetical protein